jgi:hypothetical protein
MDSHDGVIEVSTCALAGGYVTRLQIGDDFDENFSGKERRQRDILNMNVVSVMIEPFQSWRANREPGL